jgi:hemerythrin-like metal-binding protein
VNTFEWTPLFETGLAEVDVQHRSLVDMLNSLSDQLDSASTDRIDDLLKALAQYTVYHFSYEEALMIEVGLDARHTKQHCAIHARFVEQVQSWMATRQAEGQLSPEQLVDYLANWLIFHILGEDQSMGRQVLAIRSGGGSEQAWQEDRPSDDPRTVILLGALHRLYSDLLERNERLVRTQEALKSLNASLEQRVAQRTADLEAANRNLQDERQRAIETEKMASLGRMVAGFAHEVNTPIGIAVGAVSQVEESVTRLEGLLQGEEVSEEQISGSLASATESSALAMANLRRAASLVQSFKRTAVDQTSETERDFSLAQLIDDVIVTMRPMFRGTPIVFEVDCSQDISMRAVPGAWTQILTNLCTNAHKHAFENGKRVGLIQISVERDARHVQLTFRDNGAGMEADHVRQAFEPFFTTCRNDGGSGLGLYIAYSLATQTLGGTLRCNSTSGHGTEFVLNVPLRITGGQEVAS